MKIGLRLLLSLVGLLVVSGGVFAATEGVPAATPSSSATAAPSSAAPAKATDTATSSAAKPSEAATSSGAKPSETATPSAARPTTPPSYDEAMKDPQRKVGFIRKVIVGPDGAERIYAVWIPLTYTADKKWPVILFLHGLGESGSDGQKPLTQGLPKEITKRQGKFDFIVVIPQVAGSFALVRGAEGTGMHAAGGWGGPDGAIAAGALAKTLHEYSCDADRVYLTGLSMGGYGTYTLAMKHPKTFAAIVPICGGGDPITAEDLGRHPIWIWHGEADPTVPVQRSRDMVTALVKAKAHELRYTELPGVGHNSWDAAYASDDLYTWLLAHKLSDQEGAKPVKPVIDAPNWAAGAKLLEPKATETKATDTKATDSKAAEPRA
jgi:poly(3-hydroxybutyrate) depolymerase